LMKLYTATVYHLSMKEDNICPKYFKGDN